MCLGASEDHYRESTHSVISSVPCHTGRLRNVTSEFGTLGMAEGEVNQGFIFKMESPSESPVILPSTL